MRSRRDALVESSSAEFSDWDARRSSASDIGAKSSRMREVKQMIVALKDKLMERHLMSKKIEELEKILQKINDATNKVMIEMDNRVDDLNRDWQRRLQSQNMKWKDRINILCGFSDSNILRGTPDGTAGTYDAASAAWYTEKRLTEIVDRLAPIAKMEHNLEKIIKVLNRNYYSQPRPAAATANKVRSSLSEDLSTARSVSSMRTSSISNAPEIYGVVEMTETYSMCLRNLERAVKSLEAIKQMPAIFGVAPGGVSTIRDVNHVADVLNQFINKLRISLCKCNFSGSQELNFE